MFFKKTTAMDGGSEYYFGKLTRSKYMSKFLGYKCRAPKNATFMIEDDLLRISGINPALRETDPATFKEMYHIGTGVVDLMLTMPSGALVTVHWQYYPANLHGGIDVAKFCAERQVGINQENGGMVYSMPHDTELIGRRFVGLSTEYMKENGNIERLEEYFCECINGVIKITTREMGYNTNEGATLLRSLKKYK